MRYFLIISISILLISIIGCREQQASEPLDEQVQLSNELNEKNNETLTNNEIASRLANIASDVPDVEDAVAIIAGPYAVIGIDIDQHAERQEVGSIKYSVSEALRHDPYGKTAVVIADGDIVERLREMRQSMQDGYPISGIAEELAEIVSRYMPIFPVPDQAPQDSPNEIEKLPEGSEEELKRIQEEQANDK